MRHAIALVVLASCHHGPSSTAKLTRMESGSAAAPGARSCHAAAPDGAPVPEPEGATVAATPVRLDPYSCPAFEEAGYGRDQEAKTETLPTGFDVVSSAGEFEQRFHCKPPADLDFTRERLAVYRFHHETPDFTSLGAVVSDHGAIHATMETEHACQGMAPTLEHSVIAFTLPASSDPVDLAFCEKPSAGCGGGGQIP